VAWAKANIRLMKQKQIAAKTVAQVAVMEVAAPGFGEPGGFFGGSPTSGPPPTPTPKAFAPEFKQNVFVSDGTNHWPLSSDYFATQLTAQWIADKFGDGKVYEAQAFGVGSPFQASATILNIKVGDRFVNAGILAAYYKPDRNPEDKFPGVAEALIRAVLKGGL